MYAPTLVTIPPPPRPTDVSSHSPFFTHQSVKTANAAIADLEPL